ncbi:arginine ABC transporter ATP-binding protein [Acrocarpospora pleiomorpha]|uniref:ABC-type polar-amino-acid transporter n=1 Tax=Acrocarpospora pleiomorpha TaxID=90975 RepID=A0A5M3XGA8_9ACTN|nr:amino acid ABC transporter ATP-binding protein [Acrocarpospora pleiomorpha]GES20050.1 arginine ABC transporter ATP-binding protein [Acrocarpospora pleiomorpha]
MSERPMIRLVDLHKSYAGTPVLRGVDLEVARGEVVCLIGASGSGKSTLLRCVNHLEAPDAGFVEIDGELIGYRPDGRRLRALPERRIRRQRADVGMVFQSFNLFPNLTALENIVEAPISVRGLSRAEAAERAGELLAQVGLAGREHSYPRQLSGGQQQRVAIARALAMRPKVMLFDEPTSALDPELVAEVLQTIQTLAGRGMTMLVVTHELAFARDIADRVAFVDEGRILELGPPEPVLTAPRHARTRAFLGRLARPELMTKESI